MDAQKRIAFRFIALLGVVSLFGDITYEGARSVSGPYLAILGASAGVVGLVAGLGELIGYGLRLVSGYLADRSGAYWPLTFAGYGFLFSIPLLAFAGCWQLAAFLIVCERIGKAIRSPARDAILSHATKQVGRGLGFGLHEALDQIGAIIGPLIFSATFLAQVDYRKGFTILWIPAILTLVVLIVARSQVPSPEELETARVDNLETRDSALPRLFWIYIWFTFLSVAGFVNFQLISYYLKARSVVSDVYIPTFYAVAMAVDALMALAIGRIYDRVGLTCLTIIPLLTIFIPLFTFSYGCILVVGVTLWGAVVGIHETVMRAAIADITPIERRGVAYGIFNTAYGISWFLGSMIMGFLYEFSLGYLVLFVVLMEVASLALYFWFRKEISRRV